MCAHAALKHRTEHRTLIIPRFLPLSGWQVTKYGYPQYTSRATRTGIRRGAYLHREVVQYLARQFCPFPLPPKYHVHHQDFNKLNGCPCNLVVMPQCFNPAPTKQDPYTGKMISFEEFQRRYC